MRNLFYIILLKKVSSYAVSFKRYIKKCKPTRRLRNRNWKCQFSVEQKKCPGLQLFAGYLRIVSRKKCSNAIIAFSTFYLSIKIINTSPGGRAIFCTCCLRYGGCTCAKGEPDRVTHVFTLCRLLFLTGSHRMGKFRAQRRPKLKFIGNQYKATDLETYSKYL